MFYKKFLSHFGVEYKMKLTAEETGILKLNIIMVDDTTYQWIDSNDFDIVELAKQLGLDINKRIKAKITLQLVLEPCFFCERPTTGDKLCDRCEAAVCDKCAKILKIKEIEKRLCPLCYEKEKEQLQQLQQPKL